MGPGKRLSVLGLRFRKLPRINANRKERVLSLSEYQIAVSHKFYGSQPDAQICCLPCERLNRGCFNLKTQVSSNYNGPLRHTSGT